jgi:hypothetical protein
MVFFFLLQLLIYHLFRLSYTSRGFEAGLVIQQFTNGFQILFLKSCGNHAHLLKVAYNRLWGFKNYVDNKFSRVIKSSINKLLSKLVKNCYGMGFFKLAPSLKKFMARLNITQ